MTKMKLCGLSGIEEIAVVNYLRPDFIGFVFWERSSRFVSPERAAVLRSRLAPGIVPVGVFVDEAPEKVAALMKRGIIDAAQLHGSEDAEYIFRLRRLLNGSGGMQKNSGGNLAPKRSGLIIQAFRVRSVQDVLRAEESTADHILLDAGAGSGQTFDWELLRSLKRPFFLAGGLDPDNAAEAVRRLHPYAVDVSSGIETGGRKDVWKMKRFVDAVRSVK